MSVRVRYAPSPTGSPHVGNIRTALFDHLLARRFGGTMIVRLEDTDRSRYIPGCEEEILDSLNWIGIEWQEGPDVGGPHAPYRQSERAQLGIYKEWVDKLIASGHAYWAFDTPEELEAMRLTQQLNKLQVGYFGGHWREASAAQAEQARADSKPGVIRLKMPRGRKLVVHDAIRGRVEFDSDVVDDPVLLKADGMPTYHCAAMIDDHLMDITHIIRGEEWISSAPKHVWLFEALGWEPPEFVHVPVILGKDGKKLSKRHGDTKCLDYRDGGYLPEALANFIALIGWAPGGDRELMSMSQMAEAFDLSGLQPSPGVFDLDKLVWMNGSYVRSLTPAELTDRVRTYLHRPETADYWLRPEHESHKGQSLQLLENSLEKDPEYVTRAIALERERVTTLADFGEACAFFLQDETPMDAKAVEKWFGEAHVRGLLEDLVGWLDAPLPLGMSEANERGKGSGDGGSDTANRQPPTANPAPTAADCESFLRSWAETHGFEKLGPIVHPVRVSLTGKTTGPGLFELMEVLGPERMIRRLQRVKEMLR